MPAVATFGSGTRSRSTPRRPRRGERPRRPPRASRSCGPAPNAQPTVPRSGRSTEEARVCILLHDFEHAIDRRRGLRGRVAVPSEVATPPEDPPVVVSPHVGGFRDRELLHLARRAPPTRPDLEDLYRLAVDAVAEVQLRPDGDRRACAFEVGVEGAGHGAVLERREGHDRAYEVPSRQRMSAFAIPTPAVVSCRSRLRPDHASRARDRLADRIAK